MIVRERLDCYVLIKQYDHSLISGEFAQYWAERPRSLRSTLYAIMEHDVGWESLDASVSWNEEAGKPYSFTNYPTEPKLRAYKGGLDSLEARDPYAACLCSMHYASLVGDTEDELRFRESETARQRRIESAMNKGELTNLEHNFRLLQFCDDLSLFVCLNEPGRNYHPWYKDGFSFEGAKYSPVWEDHSTLRLDPTPFSEPFNLAVPYTLIEKNGRLLRSAHFELRVTC